MYSQWHVLTLQKSIKHIIMVRKNRFTKEKKIQYNSTYKIIGLL